MAPNFEGDDKVLNESPLKSLKMANNNENAEALSNFDNGRSDNIVDQFEVYEKIILQLESSLGLWKHKRRSFLWDDSIDDARKYLSAVDGILQLINNNSLLSDGKLGDRVNSIVQTAMSRFEDEFRHILIRNAVPLDGERLFEQLSVSVRRISLSFASNVSEDFENSVDDVHESLCEERRLSSGNDSCLDLMNPDAVNYLKEIAERMIRAGYEKECCQVYSSIRHDALYECVSILGVENTSIEDVQKLEWVSLDEKMRKWTKAVKTFTRFLLMAEKHLCNQVFVGSEQIKEACFKETAKGCVMQLLNFAEAIVVVQRSPEKFFRILDMYDTMLNVQLGLKALFSDDSGDPVFSEVEGVLVGLAETAKGTFMEFENAVKGEPSRKVTHCGEVHPLARYVMNYIKLLVEYNDSLNILFENNTDSSHQAESDNSLSSQLDNISPMGRRLLSLISCLESNLEDKSKLYEDDAMRYVFLMNNILYIVQKVKDSELGKVLGDHWVRKRRSQVRQYATCYLRSSWNKVLSFLKDDGHIGSGSLSKASKLALKERFKNFNTAFEDIYKSQSGWIVQDGQLRDELRISISERVIPAYRSFMGRFRCHVESVRHAGKYIKYTPEDIEIHLLDLFEGSPADLLHPKRKHRTK